MNPASEEYTPTTGEIRDHWVNVGFAGDRESFDRWLAQHDAETAGRALLDAATNPDARLSGHSGVSITWLRERAATPKET